ncbi:phage minor tail protein domain-containing protein [Vibrio ziniensis]|uniref:Tail assembly protein G domain-containing protein n=1 Tax=Vibrio ziniensis TaxID=2711221 RepID=A0A6G7CHE5_9VIBR|nr:phage minor tail protein G [Vibrio ziniensis]QIH41456.1 hypothetical protein G5S32_05355 [Vibrio ziniensis]
MAQTFLKTMLTTVGDQEVTLTQLSGLERFDFIEYVAEMEKPAMPVHPADDASPSEKEAYLDSINKVLHQFNKLTFIGQARLAAYGCKSFGEDIEQRHQFVMANFTTEQVKHIHDEVAVLSGIPLNNGDEAESSENQHESAEPIDPKQ